MIFLLIAQPSLEIPTSCKKDQFKCMAGHEACTIPIFQYKKFLVDYYPFVGILVNFTSAESFYDVITDSCNNR